MAIIAWAKELPEVDALAPRIAEQADGLTGVVSVYADADSKTLTVGFDAQYPPFGYKDDNGEYVGFI